MSVKLSLTIGTPRDAWLSLSAVSLASKEIFMQDELCTGKSLGLMNERCDIAVRYLIT